MGGNGGAPLRVVVADDTPIVVEGITSMLRGAHAEVVGTACDGAGAISVVDETVPDVVVLDLRMPPTHTDEGIVAAEAIRTAHPHIGILLLSAHLDRERAASLLSHHQRGIGYLLKDTITDRDLLVDQLHQLVAGGWAIDPTLVGPPPTDPPQDNPLTKLSEKELEVLALIAEGCSNAAIARRLFMGSRTVESHVSSMLTRLDLPPGPDHHRRVLLALLYLRNIGRLRRST